jgi:hypothetical protein
MGTQHHGPKDRHSMTTLRHLPDFKLERYFAPLESPLLIIIRARPNIEGWPTSDLLALADYDSKREHLETVV